MAGIVRAAGRTGLAGRSPPAGAEPTGRARWARVRSEYDRRAAWRSAPPCAARRRRCRGRPSGRGVGGGRAGSRLPRVAGHDAARLGPLDPVRASWVTPWCSGDSRATSAQMSSRLENPRSTPRRAASSLAIIQSGQATPRAVTIWLSQVMRSSRLVKVPRRSAQVAAGSTTSAAREEAVRWVSTATTKRAPSMALTASWASGKSRRGSAPSRTRPPMWPRLAASRIPAVSRPGLRPAGARPSGARTRPGPRRG